MRRVLLSLGLVLLWCIPASAQVAARRALRIEDYYRVKSVGSPRISPDGQWVTYTVSTPIEQTNGNAVETWLVRTSGAEQPARVRHEGQDVSNPRWRDDGRLLYTHQDVTWTLDPAQPGRPAVREDAPERNGTLSPDGRWLARAQEMPVPQRPAPAMTEFQRRHEERFQGDQIDWYPFLQDGQEFPAPNRRARPPSEIVIEPADGSAPARQLTRLGLQPQNLRWRPDGRALLFTADEAYLDELAFGHSDLFLVTVDGQLTRLTDDGFQYSGVGFSPDGRWMSYVRSLGTDTIIAPPRLENGGPEDLYIRPAAGGEPINLTAAFDMDVGTPMWTPDSRYIYFTTGIGGETHLFRVAPTGGAVEQVTRGPRRINDLEIDRAFRRMTYTVGEFEKPEDVYAADSDGSNERRLTDVHRDFLAEVEVATRPAERIRWNSYDGTPVEGFLLFPHGYSPQGGPYPLIVMNHGGPHSASGYGFNFKNSLFNAHGYFVFLPNFRSSTGYGDAFKWGTWGGWGENDGEDVVSGVDHLVARFPIDRSRVGTTGHSYGGILTNWLLTRYSDRFRAAIPGAGESNWTSNYSLRDGAGGTKETEFLGPPWDPKALDVYIRQSPYFHCAGVKTATLFVHGKVDYRVPLSGALQLYTCLKKQGTPTKLLLYDDMPHGIRGHWNNVHRMMHELGWWEQYLKPPLGEEK
ncbi:MAG: S9 family peptidase [Gemmatimonadetes bacterium]|nr:S9 family peptidase [Gemmatimonadota bacterium]